MTNKELDKIFDKVDDLLFDGKFEEVDRILFYLVPEKMETTEILAYLVITLMWCNKLKNREDYYNRAKKWLEKSGELGKKPTFLDGLIKE